MTNAWIQKRKRDQYYRLAKIRGYRSRAAYKLLQAVRVYGIIQPGDKVVDLGSHPGGWLQVAREAVGPEGLVVGVDIKALGALHYSNVKILTMDTYSKEVVHAILAETNGQVDTVLSDLAPSIIGAWEVDHARQVDLASRAFEIGKEILKQGGNSFVKLFQGVELKKFQKEAAEFFTSSRLLKPKASRPESSEVYFLGLGFRPGWHPSVVENSS